MICQSNINNNILIYFGDICFLLSVFSFFEQRRQVDIPLGQFAC